MVGMSNLSVMSWASLAGTSSKTTANAPARTANAQSLGFVAGLRENWLYWLVIDAVSVYIYLERGLVLTAFLFMLYLVLIVIGWRRWWLDWRSEAA